jgi:hypothetical protein
MLQHPYLLEQHSALLDEMERHPQFFQGPTTATERRATAAAVLTNAAHQPYGVWQNARLVGILLLTGRVEGLDASFHFLFLDGNLVGKRQLLRRFLDLCFGQLGFRRLTVQVPEDADKLVRFYRQLGFTYEGEGLAARNGFPVASAASPATSRSLTAKTIAKYGSRVEGVMWRNDRWIDMYRLRLLRSEWMTQETPHADTSRSARRRRPHRGQSDWQGHRPGPVADQSEHSAGPQPEP